MSRSITVMLPKGHDPALVGDFLMQMAYCDPGVEDYALIENGEGAVAVRIADGASAAEIERKANLLASRMLAPSRKPAVLVKEWLSGLPANSVNYEEQLAERGWVRAAGPGLYHLAGVGLELFEYFDRRFLQIALDAGAVAERYPPFISVQSLHKLGFFDATPQYATFVSHFREDVDLIDRFMGHVAAAGTVVEPGASLSVPAHVLASTVCCHSFAGRMNTIVDQPLVVTACNTCTRYEARNLAHLDRLWSFNMREIIYMAESPDFAEQGRSAILDATEALLSELQLSYRIERANDLFFAPDSSKRVSFQRGLGLKLEVRLLVQPTGKTVACGSFNLHHTNFGRKMGINGPSGAPINSSCIGFGIERWVYCFLQQHGLDRAEWPAAVRNTISE